MNVHRIYLMMIHCAVRYLHLGDLFIITLLYYFRAWVDFVWLTTWGSPAFKEKDEGDLQFQHVYRLIYKAPEVMKSCSYPCVQYTYNFYLYVCVWDRECVCMFTHVCECTHTKRNLIFTTGATNIVREKKI